MVYPSAGTEGGIAISGSDVARIRLVDEGPGSSLYVEGGSQPSDKVKVMAGGGMTVDGGLNVAGGSTTLSGATTVGGNLRVNGGATLDSALDVAGVVNVGPAGSLSVVGQTTTGQLTVSSNATVGGNLIVNGSITGTINPSQFDSRYILRTGAEQTFNGDLINTSGGNYRNPIAATTGCISTQVFSGPYYYGPDSTSNIYIGQSNPVHVPGSIQTPVVYDRDDPGYYVDPAAASNVQDLTVNGSFSRPSGEPSLPVAYGYIKGSGGKGACTSNVGTVTYTGGYYQIHINGVSYSGSHYITVVTPFGTGPAVPTVHETAGGDLKVTLYNLSGGTVAQDFQFVVYKP